MFQVFAKYVGGQITSWRVKTTIYPSNDLPFPFAEITYEIKNRKATEKLSQKYFNFKVFYVTLFVIFQK